AEDQARRRAMLEPAVTVADGETQEPIAIERRGPPEEVDLRFAELLEIGRYALEIRVETPGDDEPVRHSARLERRALEVADLDGMVEQLVVVRRAVLAEALLVDVPRRERRRDVPRLADGVPRPLERDFDLLVVAALGQQENARTVEVAAASIEIRAADGQVECVDDDRDRKLALGAAHEPRVARGLLDRQRTALSGSADRDD